MYTIFTWLFVLILLSINLFHLSLSHTIINSLPGFPGQLPFKLETGYVGVREESLQLFYYFVESERNPREDPIILSIPGGPGCSALHTFFFQYGPVEFDVVNFEVGKLPHLNLAPYRWSKVASILFVDPARTGFSYPTIAGADKISDTIAVEIFYEFLRKWILDHPEHANTPLYTCGVSYAGIIIPVLATKIINGNEEGSTPKLNFKGYISGNPLTDRHIDFNAKIPYAHQFALLSDEIFELAKTHCQGNYFLVNPANELCVRSMEKVNECLDRLFVNNILEPICLSDLPSRRMLQHQTSHSNTTTLSQPQLPEGWCREDSYDFADWWARDKSVQKALNIREGTIELWIRCNLDHYAIGKKDTDGYKYDIPSSLAYHRNLTHKVARALIYSGDHDLVFPYIGTRKWIHTLNLNLDRSWTPWFVNNQVAGYTEIYSHKDYSLTYATVKGAGHSTPEFKPEESINMLDRWLNHKLL